MRTNSYLSNTFKTPSVFIKSASLPVVGDPSTMTGLEFNAVAATACPCPSKTSTVYENGKCEFNGIVSISVNIMNKYTHGVSLALLVPLPLGRRQQRVIQVSSCGVKKDLSAFRSTSCLW